MIHWDFWPLLCLSSLVPRLPPSLEVWLGSAGSVVQQTVVVRNTVCRKEREGGSLVSFVTG